MPVISKIKAQKSSKGRSASGRNKRVNIYLDGKFAFGLDTDNLLKAGLSVGQELSEKEIEDLIFKGEFQKLLDKSLRLISFRPRSEKEIRDYLEKRISNFEFRHARFDAAASAASRAGISNFRESHLEIKTKLIDKVIKKLKKQRLIDDQAFAAWWLEQRATFRPRGKFALRVELRQKGISREIIQEAIDEIDEVFLAQKAVAKKLKAYKKLPPLEFRQKMSAFLSRQGFSWEVIREVWEKIKLS